MMATQYQELLFVFYWEYRVSGVYLCPLFFFLFFYNESAYCFFIIFIQDTYFFNTLLFKYLMILKWWQINEINSNYLPSYLNNCADSCCFTTIFWMMYFSAFFRYIFFPFIYSYAPENKGFLPTGSTNSQVRV